MLSAEYLYVARIEDLLRLAKFAHTAVPRQRPFESELDYKRRLVHAILRGL